MSLDEIRKIVRANNEERDKEILLVAAQIDKVIANVINAATSTPITCTYGPFKGDDKLAWEKLKEMYNDKWGTSCEMRTFTRIDKVIDGKDNYHTTNMYGAFKLHLSDPLLKD